MLKQLVNEARFTLVIETVTPLLVKAGNPSIDGPDMAPVRTWRDGGWQVFIPGSSLKGVFRSSFEKIARSLATSPVVCNPFWRAQDRDRLRVEEGRLCCPGYEEVFCGSKFELRHDGSLLVNNIRWRSELSEHEREIQPETVYRDSCPACRLFGSTWFIGRVSIGDAYLAYGGRERTELRDGVGIDRLTGGAATRAQAKFNLQVISPGIVFAAQVLLRNFEAWQLGGLLAVAADMETGLVRLGSGRSRGLGQVTARIDKVTISYLGLDVKRPPTEIWGLGRLLGGAYGTSPDDVLALGLGGEPCRVGIRTEIEFTGPALEGLRKAAMADFVRRMTEWVLPETMAWDYLRWREG